MPERAQVTSIEAIESFRSALVVYISRARPVLEEVSADVLRTRSWLENDQRNHWQNELKRRLRVLEQAQQTLFSSRISNLRDETSAEVMAVHRAKRAVEEAQQKLRIVKLWDRDFESRVQPLLKQVEKLHTLYANELPKAIAHLAQLTKSLEDYADVPASQRSAPPETEPGNLPPTS
jgi:hypothetical protein